MSPDVELQHAQLDFTLVRAEEQNWNSPASVDRFGLGDLLFCDSG
jgi:hypothetical protein